MRGHLDPILGDGGCGASPLTEPEVHPEDYQHGEQRQDDELNERSEPLKLGDELNSPHLPVGPFSSSPCGLRTRLV